MSKNILCVDILKNDVYIEYTNGDIEYVSFTKAKQIIKFISPHKFIFSCSDSHKSNKFFNTLLGRYKIEKNYLTLR